MSKRVLVIDEDETLRGFLVRALEGKGCDVEIAVSGEEAVSKLGQTQFDVVYHDFRKSGANDIATFDQLRKHRNESTVYVVTAFQGALSEQLRRAEAAGGRFRLLYKPIGIEQIITAVMNILGNTSTVEGSSVKGDRNVCIPALRG